MGCHFFNRDDWWHKLVFSLKDTLMRTHFFVIFDRSNYLVASREAHIEGLKALIEKQQDLNPEPLLTCVQYYNETPFDLIYDAVPISHATSFEINPRGLAPLFDSIGKTLLHAQKTVKEDELPVFIIIAGGRDNFSVEWDQLPLQHAMEQSGWQFHFINNENIEASYEAINASCGCGVMTA